MKANADNKATVRIPDIQEGDRRVLLKQKKLNKLTTPYEIEPYLVSHVNGRQITAQNRLHQVTRHVNLFKKLLKTHTEDPLEEEEVGTNQTKNQVNSTDEPTVQDGMDQQGISKNPTAPMPRTPSTRHPQSGDNSPQPNELRTEPEEMADSPSEPQLGPRRSARTNVQRPVRYRDTDGQPAP